jgi:uncharacterized membrane protein HdeD (DUF308 family)
MEMTGEEEVEDAGPGEIEAPPKPPGMDVATDMPWWGVVLFGILMVVFGVIAMVYTDVALWTLIVLFGAIAFVQGILMIIASFAVKKENPGWMVLFLVGIISIILGVVVMVWPDVSATIVLYLVAAWFLIMGLMMLVWAIRNRHEEVPGKMFYAIGGLVAIIFALIAFAWPKETVLTILWIIGLFALIFGIFIIIAGFMAKKNQ